MPREVNKSPVRGVCVNKLAVTYCAEGSINLVLLQLLSKTILSSKEVAG